MKLFKTFAATAAVASLVMLSSCQDVTEATTEELADKGISVKSIELYNTWDKTGFSGLDAVKAEGVKVSEGADNDGYVKYLAADSARIDFKAVNNYDRASHLASKLTSLNGTKYAAVDSTEFAEVTKSVRRFQTNLKKLADAATLTELVYSAESPYFVAKLGDSRGYVLANVTSIDADFVNDSPDNTGKAMVDYYFISNEDITEYAN